MCQLKDRLTEWIKKHDSLEIIILSEVSQIEKDKYHIILLTCGI